MILRTAYTTIISTILILTTLPQRNGDSLYYNGEHIASISGFLRFSQANITSHSLSPYLADDATNASIRICCEIKALAWDLQNVWSVAHDRQMAQQRFKALSSPMNHPHIPVNIYIHNQFMGGVLGKAINIAEELVRQTKPLRMEITLYEFLEGKRHSLQPQLPDFQEYRVQNPFSHDIRIKAMTTTEFIEKKPYKNAHIHFIIDGEPGNRWPGAEVIPKEDLVLEPWGELYKNEIENGQDSFILDQTLLSSLGIIYLNKRLLNRKLTRDSWTPEKLFAERKSWLQSLIQPKNLEKIRRFLPGLDLEKTIWSWGYFQTSDQLYEELDILFSALNAGYIKDDLFVKRGKGVLIHLRPGFLAYYGKRRRIPDKEPFEASLLAERGANVVVINSKGSIDFFPALKEQAIPITFIIYPEIKKSRLESLQAELCGTTIKVNNPALAPNPFYVEFPVIDTGTASWLEAISSGSISLHDNNQAGTDQQYKILIPSIMWSLAQENPFLDHTDLTEKVRQTLSEMLLGDRTHMEKYKNLIAWTLEARKFANSMFVRDGCEDLRARIISYLGETTFSLTQPTTTEEILRRIEDGELLTNEEILRLIRNNRNNLREILPKLTHKDLQILKWMLVFSPKTFLKDSIFDFKLLNLKALALIKMTEPDKSLIFKIWYHMNKRIEDPAQIVFEEGTIRITAQQALQLETSNMPLTYTVKEKSSRNHSLVLFSS